MRKKIKYLAFLLSSVLLVSCGKNAKEQVMIEGANTSESVESNTEASENTEEISENVNEVVEELVEENIFSRMPRDYTFSSGAGAWATDISVSEDGSFVGKYHDWDAGFEFICDFSGKFSKPKPTEKPYIYSMKLQKLNIDNKDKIGTTEVIDNIVYIYEDEPYGFEYADEFLIYMPGTPMAEIPSACDGFMFLSDSLYTEIPDEYYMIYNVGGQEVFCGVSEDSVWNWTFKYEYGGANAKFRPGYDGSFMSLYPGNDSYCSFAFSIPWDGHDNGEDCWEVDDNGSKLKVTIKPDNKPDSEEHKYLITIENLSDPQYDFSKWGSNEPGKFSAVFRGIRDDE